MADSAGRTTQSHSWSHSDTFWGVRRTPPAASGHGGERSPTYAGPSEIKLESVDRAGGYWTTRSEGAENFHARTSGIYLRADPGDAAVLDSNDAAERAALIRRRLEEWKSFANS